MDAVKACREVKLYLRTLLSLALYGGKSLASRSDGFTREESDRQAASIRRLNGLRAGLHTLKNRSMSWPRRE
jgi:hypothetical protein